MSRRIYVASTWRNKFQPDVVEFLRSLGHKVYDFRNPTQEFDNPNGLAHGFHWEDIDPEWETWDTRQYLYHLHTHPLTKQGFESDKFAMEWADTCVLVLPAGPSAHLEAGAFTLRPGKEFHVLFPRPVKVEPDLMYKLANDTHIDLVDLGEALLVPV